MKVRTDIERKVFLATADTLEGLGVGEILSLLTIEPVDGQAVREAFKALIAELRSRGSAK